MEDFRKFADEGNGVLLITHDIELALEVADRIVVFYAGKTVEEAPVSDFRSEETRQPIFIDSRRVGICDIDKWRHRQVKIGSIAYYGYYS